MDEHRPPAPQLTVVTQSACHLCDDAHRALDDIARGHDVAVQYVESATEEGAALLARHRPPMMPLVLLDGAYFSAGRLPRKKLLKALSLRDAGRLPHAGGAVHGH